MATAEERARANLDVITDQLDDIRSMLEYEFYADLHLGKVNWQHVGDLARIRGLLNEVLCQEDADPE